MEANDDLRFQIVARRQAGRSRSEIRETPGPISTRLISDALRGTPPPEWTRRPRAKDGLHAEARKLRTGAGLQRDRRAARSVQEHGVGLGPRPAGSQPGAALQERRGGSATFRDREQAYRDDSRAVAASEIGQLSDREMIIAGAIDVAAAGRFWQEVTGAPDDQFRRPTLKDRRMDVCHHVRLSTHSSPARI